MTRYWVEFKDYEDNHISIYMYAYSAKQIRNMLPEYLIIAADTTE
jgi:hypothetical protein